MRDYMTQNNITYPSYQQRRENDQVSNQGYSTVDPLQQTKVGRGDTAPHLIIDNSFANLRDKSKRAPVNRSHGPNVIPKTLRPKSHAYQTQRPQSNYRIKDGKLLLGNFQSQPKQQVHRRPTNKF